MVLLTVCLILGGASARSATSDTDSPSDWQPYHQRNNGDAFFYDRRSVVRQGDRIQVERRVRFRASLMGAYSYQELLEIDCKQLKERALRKAFFSDPQWRIPAMAPDTSQQPFLRIDETSPTRQLVDVFCEV